MKERCPGHIKEDTSPVLSIATRLLRGACPERHEILRFAQNDRKRRARNDRE